MRRLARRLARDEAGQGLAEYGIVMALVGGVHRLEQLAGTVMAEPSTALFVAGGVLVVMLWLGTGRRR